MMNYYQEELMSMILYQFPPRVYYANNEIKKKLHKKMEIFIKVVVVVVDDDERLEVQKSHRHPFGILVGQQ